MGHDGGVARRLGGRRGGCCGHDRDRQGQSEDRASHLRVLRDRRPGALPRRTTAPGRSEEHTSELQSLMRISYAVFCLKKKKANQNMISLYQKKNLNYTTTPRINNTITDN